MNRSKSTKRIFPLHPAATVLLSLGLFGAVIHFICALSPSFSDFINSTAGYAIRLLLSKIFSIFPFSFMEYLLYSSPLIITVVAVCAVKCAGKGGSYILRALGGVLSIAAGIYFLFAVSFAPGYHGTSLAEKTGLEQREVSAEELYETELIIIDELNGLCESISYEYDGSSLMPFSLGELSKELSSCYEDVYRTYGFPNTFSSKVKPLIISPLMTYTHLSGIYSFFTGEANLNTNYPHFVNVFTSAHEMAHQRGVAREDEANFMAFLVCRTSENDYVRYCAYMNMFEYLSDALYSANKELWAEAYAKLSPKAVSELRAYSAFFDKYRESTASRVTDTLNNAYLESQGTEGTKSYGMVVDLAVSFYLD